MRNSARGSLQNVEKIALFSGRGRRKFFFGPDFVCFEREGPQNPKTPNLQKMTANLAAYTVGASNRYHLSNWRFYGETVQCAFFGLQEGHFR